MESFRRAPHLGSLDHPPAHTLRARTALSASSLHLTTPGAPFSAQGLAPEAQLWRASESAQPLALRALTTTPALPFDARNTLSAPQSHLMTPGAPFYAHGMGITDMLLQRTAQARQTARVRDLESRLAESEMQAFAFQQAYYLMRR